MLLMDILHYIKRDGIAWFNIVLDEEIDKRMTESNWRNPNVNLKSPKKWNDKSINR